MFGEFIDAVRIQAAGLRPPVVAAAVVLAVLVAFGEVGALAALLVLAAVTVALVLAPVRASETNIALDRRRGSDETDPLNIARAVVAALPDPVLIVDRSGTILFQNDKTAAVLGLRERGQHISSALRDPEVLGAITSVLESREAARVDYMQQVPIPRHFEVLVAPVSSTTTTEIDDGAPAILIVMHDLTRQERIERMRADFVAYASHELRTPLASLIGFVETLQGPARNDPAARDRFLGIMRVEAARMSRLIDDLLSLSRIELNAHVPPTRSVDVVQIVHHVVDTLSQLAADSGVRIASPARREPLEVAGDYDELIQVFQNLIENAIKYGQSGERIEVDVGPAAIDLRGDAVAGVTISVRDWGPGIAAEHIPRLTERFYRVDASHSRDKGGTGLGLAIVKHILNRHRGNLTVRSSLGSGSTFTVSLPLAERSHSAASKQVA